MHSCLGTPSCTPEHIGNISHCFGLHKETRTKFKIQNSTSRSVVSLCKITVHNLTGLDSLNNTGLEFTTLYVVELGSTLIALRIEELGSTLMALRPEDRVVV